MEHRTAHQRVFRFLPGAHRRSLRSFSQLRSASTLRLLRNRHCAQVFPHRHLGFHAARVRGHEAGHLFLRRLGDGAHRLAGGLRHLGQPLHQPYRIRSCGIPCRLSDVVLSAGLYRFCDSCRHVAVPHLGAHRPRRRAHCCFHAAGRRGDEAGRIRLPSRWHCSLSSRP